MAWLLLLFPVSVLLIQNNVIQFPNASYLTTLSAEASAPPDMYHSLIMGNHRESPHQTPSLS